jgi:hypothetical protein
VKASQYADSAGAFGARRSSGSTISSAHSSSGKG